MTERWLNGISFSRRHNPRLSFYLLSTGREEEQAGGRKLRFSFSSDVCPVSAKTSAVLPARNGNASSRVVPQRLSDFRTGARRKKGPTMHRYAILGNTRV